MAVHGYELRYFGDDEIIGHFLKYGGVIFVSVGLAGACMGCAYYTVFRHRDKKNDDSTPIRGFGGVSLHVLEQMETRQMSAAEREEHAGKMSSMFQTSTQASEQPRDMQKEKRHHDFLFGATPAEQSTNGEASSVPDTGSTSDAKPTPLQGQPTPKQSPNNDTNVTNLQPLERNSRAGGSSKGATNNESTNTTPTRINSSDNYKPVYADSAEGGEKNVAFKFKMVKRKNSVDREAELKQESNFIASSFKKPALNKLPPISKPASDGPKDPFLATQYAT